MGLVKGSNTYVTRSEANLYFATRIDVNAWDSASESKKDKALATATSLLDEFTWVGIAVSVDQLLAFPRVGSYFDPRLGVNKTFTAEIPARISTATCELALHLLVNEDLLVEAGSVSDVSVGSIRITDIKEVPVIPSIVRNIIKPLLLNQGSTIWWRAN